MKVDKLDSAKTGLLDKLLEIDPSIARSIDLGACWGVDGGYSQYLLERHGFKKVVIVDKHITDATLDWANISDNTLCVQKPLGSDETLIESGDTDVVMLFDVLHHQVLPDWKEVIAKWASHTKYFIIYNPMWTVGSESLRLIDYGLEWYKANVPYTKEKYIDDWFKNFGEFDEGNERKKRDSSNFWQFGITEKDLIVAMNELGFSCLHSELYKSRPRKPWIKNYGYIFCRKEPSDSALSTESRFDKKGSGTATNSHDSSEEVIKGILEVEKQVEKALRVTLSDVFDPFRNSLNQSNAKMVESIKRAQEKVEHNNYRQLESLLWLKSRMLPGLQLPPLRTWAASPDVLLALHEYIVEAKPRLVLELGSGASSIVIADALKQNGEGTLVTLEHSEYYGDITKGNLDRFGLGSFVDIRISALVEWSGEQLESESEGPNYWYSSTSVSDLSEIDLLFVDGPPGTTCPFARYPAMPALIDRLSADAQVWVDDSLREEEQSICKNWAKKYKLDIRNIHLEKGLCVLSGFVSHDSPKSPKDGFGKVQAEK